MSGAEGLTLPYPPGTIVGGRYRVERKLGSGGMGWVVVATHLHLEQRVAIKFLHAEQAAAFPEAVARFLREAKAAARIQSDHVARVSDFGTLDDGAPYLVMEYLEGNDLDSLLQARGALPVGQAVEYVLQACEGLAEAHAAGIVHRDLKPANLFLARRSDGSSRIKLLDFGISKLDVLPGSAPEGNLTSTKTLMGSPLYMAPEQLRSLKQVDRRADIWSMGIILYELLSGHSPFTADTLPEVCARIMTEPPPDLRGRAPRVPEALAAVVGRCLEKEPARRFGDVAALAQALAPFAGEGARARAEALVRILSAAGRSAEVASPASSPADDVAHAQTRASFGRTSGSSVPKGWAVPAAIAATVVGGGLLAIVATSAARGRAEVKAPPSANVALARSPGEAEPAAATADTAMDRPPPAPAASVAPSAEPVPSAPERASAAPEANNGARKAAAPPANLPHVAPPAATHPAATARPKASAAVAPSAAPAATNGFGGRD
jgi:serine/threonine-protein kinase